MSDDFKETIFSEKSNKGIIRYWPGKNKGQICFFGYLSKKLSGY
jgi:hypothetical protein